MNKKMTLAFGVMLATGTMLAAPHGGRGPAPMAPRRPAPAPVVNHRPAPAPVHHHTSAWGRGGRNFWPGFVGGIIGGALTDVVVGPRVVTTSVVAAPVVATAVVATPVYTTQQFWVPGTYVDQIQPNGTVIRVWHPGHYETRQVLVQ